MRKNVTELCLFDEKTCPITGLDRTSTKTKNGIKYKIFHKSVLEKFYKIYDEYKLNPHGKGRFAKSCFINELFYGNVTLDEIDKEYIEKHLNFYNPANLDYYIKLYDGDVVRANVEYKNRQSTTSKRSFIKKYGDVDGIKRYNEHYKNIHKSISGENHWIKRLNTNRENYISEKFGHTNKIYKNYKHLADDDASKKRSENSKKWIESIKHTDYFENRVNSWKIIMKSYIEDLKKDKKLFFVTFGCWKACYNFSIKNNIPYTDENRILIWKTLFDKKDKSYWINLGFSEEESIKKAMDFFKFKNTSKSEINCINEIENILGVNFKKQYPIGNYVCDAVLDDKKIVVEFFGDYWHKNPKINRFSDEEIYNRKLIDDFKIKYIEENGYSVYVIWENEWKYNKKKILSELKLIL